MKPLKLILVCLSSAAYAQGGSNIGSAPSLEWRQYSTITSTKDTRTSARITQNANDCPPDRAEAVWGAGSVLVGYTCVTPSAN